jgi:hypothetical protein
MESENLCVTYRQGDDEMVVNNDSLMITTRCKATGAGDAENPEELGACELQIDVEENSENVVLRAMTEIPFSIVITKEQFLKFARCIEEVCE